MSLKAKKYLPSSILLIISIIAIIAVLQNIKSFQTFFSKASGKPADLVIDTSVSSPLEPTWNYLAQGGEEVDYSFTPIANKVSTLKPRYIRIDHIYDFFDVVTLGPRGELQYNWAELDRVVNEITSLGATPFISLSYMPPALTSGDVVDAPRDYAHWQQLIQKTIEHISGVNGLNLKNVYYEVWNEPDLFGDWKTYGDKNYLYLYHAASRGAQSTRNTNAFFFGGPATTALYPNWITQFLDYVSENDLRLDFYSWHRYDYETNAYATDALLLSKYLNRYPRYQNIEKIVSEWGIDSENNTAYDSPVSAAHALASLFHMDSQVDKAFIFEIQDGKDQGGETYWGRWGLLTHASTGSVEKPRFKALALLNRLKGEKLEVKGQGSWVKAFATKNDNGYQVVVVNYDPQNTHTESVPIAFTNISPGKYTLKKEYLGREQSKENVLIQEDVFKTQESLPTNHILYLELNKQ